MNRYDLEILAKTIYGEARGETEEGQIAVACCILNRFNSRKWFSSDTIAGVCQKPWQFSCWNRNDHNYTAINNLPFTNYSRYFRVIKKALEKDITNGATHYYAPSLTKCPEWAKGKTPCAEIGNHLFFKDID